MPLRVGVLTDTHVGDELTRLPEEVLERLADADLILHAGDLIEPGVLGELEQIAPVVAVRGNHDPGDLVAPDRTVLEIEGARIGLTHGIRPMVVERLSAAAWVATGRLDIAGHCRALVRGFPPVDCVVFGHLHIPVRRMVGTTLCFSPGPVYQPESDPSFDWSSRSRRIYRAVRSRLPASYRRPAIGMLDVSRGRIRARAIALDEPLGPGAPPA
jgi:putative phosphoesterase